MSNKTSITSTISTNMDTDNSVPSLTSPSTPAFTSEHELMNYIFGSFESCVHVLVHNHGYQAEVDLDVSFSEGDYAQTLLIERYVSYVSRLVEVIMNWNSDSKITDDYIIESFMNPKLKIHETDSNFHISRSDYGDDMYYGLSIHIVSLDPYRQFNEEYLIYVCHWAWNHVGVPSIGKVLNISYDEAVKSEMIRHIDDINGVSLNKYSEDYGYKLKLKIPHLTWKGTDEDIKTLEILGVFELACGGYPNCRCSAYKNLTIRFRNPDDIKKNWYKDFGDLTYYAVNEMIMKSNEKIKRKSRK